MKFIKKNLIILFVSVLLFLITLKFFKPILIANNLIFPYSVTKFDIITNYPKIWHYIKITYCTNCFITIYLLINSLQKFISLKRVKKPTKIIEASTVSDDGINLLLGTNAHNNQNIYLSEKSLFQNLLITGTIGSRKNRFCNVSSIKSINGV